jgi:acyl-CoA thioester hydrolase
MIDINFFSRNKSQASTNERTQELPVLNKPELQITYRGIVYPWQLDHMHHMNVRSYMDCFDQASWVLLALLGLDSWYFERNRRGMAALEQNIRYKSELRAGEAFEIRSSVLEVGEKTLRMQHDMHRVRTGGLAASTTILGVHIDADARRGAPLPAGVADRAHFLNASMLDAHHDFADRQARSFVAV